MTIKPVFAWYDCWIGIFWDSRKRKLYILPVPCIGVMVDFNKVNERLKGETDVKRDTKRKLEIRDNFNGSNRMLRASIRALIELDDAGCLVPHGIGGHARTLLSACYQRLKGEK